MDKFLEFLKPLVQKGQTRFLCAIAGIGAEVFLVKFTEAGWHSFLAVAVITVTYIVAKTIHDVKKVSEVKNGT